MSKVKFCFPALLALCALAFASCASPARAPLPADANPSAELDRLSGEIEEMSRMQYDRLAPENFDRAVDYRNAASEKLRDGKAHSEVLDNLAVASQSIRDVRRVGDAHADHVRGILVARKNAISAQAPQFQENKFRDADEALRDLGQDMEKGKFELDAEEMAEIEKNFSEAEIAARKHAELGNSRLMFEKAEDNGAKSRTPGLYEVAEAKLASGELSIEVNGRQSAAYAPSVQEAKHATQKLTEVLAIARKNDTTEDAALALWNQNQQLLATQAALAQSKASAESDMVKSQAAAAGMESELEDKNASISALSSKNRQYASEEELKQRIEELRKTFKPEEAEVLKDGNKLVVRLKKMQFSSGRAELNPNAFETLQKVEELIAAVPAKQITVEGHADASGPEKENKVLSEQRAESVKKYFESHGLAEELEMDTAGYGSARPLNSNRTKQGRATNRRVDIVIETPVVL